MKTRTAKNLIFAIMAALVLLAGCSVREQPVLPSPEPTPEPTPVRTIMDKVVDSDSGLQIIELPEIEMGTYMTARNLDGKLLLIEELIMTDRFMVVDLITGDVLAQRELKKGNRYYNYQVNGDLIAMSTYDEGPVIVMNSDLETVIETPGIDVMGDKYISHDLTKVYITCYDDDMRVLDLETMEYSTCGIEGTSAYVVGSVGDRLSVRFNDLENMRSECAIVNMASGSITMNPTGARVATLSQSGGTWFGCSEASYNTFFISDAVSTQRIKAPGMNMLNLDPVSGNLVGQYEDGSLHVFDREGRCISSAVLGEKYVAGDTVYSDCWNGYFMSVYDYVRDRSVLAFWDLENPPWCDDLSLSAPHFETPEGQIQGLQELYARAEAIGNKYNITVLVADQCDTQYTDFGAEQASEYFEIENALDILEEALGYFPEGFTQQLVCGYIEKIVVNLTGELYATNEWYGTGSYSGFVDNCDELCKVAMNVYEMDTQTVFHEFSHIIDNRLDLADSFMGGTEFTYTGWYEMQPEGFDYTYSYTDYGYDVDFGYFIDGYSTTYPTEDRARIFEYAAGGCDYAFYGCDGLIAKLDYYCRCIRSCFDTTGWPEVTVWEQPLVNLGWRG